MAHNVKPSSALGVADDEAVFHSVLMKSKLLLLIIIGSLGFAPVHGADKKTAESTPELKIHPKIFTYIEGWLSDGESPIATEINLDAAEGSANQFNTQEIKQEDGWIRCPGRDGMGFLRYRVLESKGHHYKVAYQENGGGTLTTEAIIEFSIEKRDIKVDGKPQTIRVLRVFSYANKP
jgi:hypothetical protein